MRTEKVIACLVILGLLFKFVLHLPGASVILIISLLSLSGLYFPLAFYFFSDKEIKNQNLALSIISGMFWAVIPIGILFKLMYWPGASIQLLIGVAPAPILLGIVYFLKNKASTELATYYKNMLLRAWVLTILGWVVYLTSTATFINIQYGKDPELARLKTLSYTNPDNEEYAKQLESYEAKKDSIYRNEIMKEDSAYVHQNK